MMIAIAAGLAAGIVGFLPLFFAMRLSRRSLSVATRTMALSGLAGVFVSMVVRVVELVACAKLARTAVLPFGLAEMLSLVASTSVYTLFRNGIIARKKRS